RTTNVGLAGKLGKCPDCGAPVRVPPEATSEDLPVPSAQGEQRIRPTSRQTLERPEAEESAIRQELVHGRERRAKSGGDAARQWRRSDDDLRPRPPGIRKPVDVVAVVVAAVAILYIAMLVFFAVGAF